MADKDFKMRNEVKLLSVVVCDYHKIPQLSTIATTDSLCMETQIVPSVLLASVRKISRYLA